MRRCPHCTHRLTAADDVCPSCGEPTPLPLRAAPVEVGVPDPHDLTGAPDPQNLPGAPQGYEETADDVRRTLVSPPPQMAGAARPVPPLPEVVSPDPAAAAPHPRDGGPGTAMQDLPMGAVLGGTYEVIAKIGQGAMGDVYEVEHMRMRKRFAAKVLTPAASSVAEYVKRLEREAIVISRIEHPNIVQVVTLDETDEGRVFVILELLHGQELAGLIRKGPLPIDQAITLGVILANALQAAHDEGIVHRDLKPGNVFLARRQGATIPKVLDFGVSKVDLDDERLTKTGVVVGTPVYMSPEHGRGARKVDERADIYSLGVILFEMVTGRVPFGGRSALDILSKHITEAPVDPRTIRPDLPAEVVAVIMKALAKSADDRYQSMRDLGVALGEAAQAAGLPEGALPYVAGGTGVSIPEVQHAELMAMGSGEDNEDARPTVMLNEAPMMVTQQRRLTSTVVVLAALALAATIFGFAWALR